MQVVAFYRNPAWQLELRQGVRAALPAAPGVVAWGLVTGVAMVKSGLAVPWAIAISLLVYAGSAQLATLPLIVAGQPFWIVALAAFVTNLRFVIYSASLRRWFDQFSLRRRAELGYFTGDFTFAMFMQRARRVIRIEQRIHQAKLSIKKMKHGDTEHTGDEFKGRFAADNRSSRVSVVRPIARLALAGAACP